MTGEPPALVQANDGSFAPSGKVMLAAGVIHEIVSFACWRELRMMTYRTKLEHDMASARRYRIWQNA